MSSNSAKKTRAPRTPYVPPAARRSANAGNTSDNLSCRQDDSNIGKSRRPSAVGDEGVGGLRGANESGQRAGVVGPGAGRSPGKGVTSSQRRVQGVDAKGGQVRPATAATTATTTTAAAPETTTQGAGGASHTTAVPKRRPPVPTANLITPSTAAKPRSANKPSKTREQEHRGEFQRQCSAKPTPGDNTDTCHEQLLVPALDATNNTEAARGPAAETERARGETDASVGKGRRKPRQAWSQYVPPKRRGSPASGSAAEEAQPRRQPSPPEDNAATRVDIINSAPSGSSLGSTSSPGESCSTVGRDAPTLATSGSTPKACSSELTSDTPDRGAPSLGEGDGAIKSEDPSRVVANGTTAMGATAVGVDHEQRCHDRSAEMDISATESQLEGPAEEKAVASVAEAPSDLPAGAAGAAGGLLGRSDDDCSVDVGALPNQGRAPESECVASGCPSEANTATSCDESMPVAMAEEAEAPPRSTPPLQAYAGSSGGSGSSGSGGSNSGSDNTAARNRSPTSQAARDGQAQTQDTAPTTPGEEIEAGRSQSPPELGGDTSGGNAAAAGGEEKKSGDSQELPASQELPVAKAPSARYVPPGRRKIIDAEVAAFNETGESGTAGGMGPLWTSRAPVRVSQRARPSDRESSPVRPSPARVAGVVSGGMSAYGANISEYSELMSRDQVEACTAVVSNFPSALPPGQRDLMLQPFVALGGLVVWPRPDEALVTFATPALARQALSNRHNRSSVLLVEALSEAREEKRRGYRRVELARPGRPPADASSASRLISGALGIRRPRAKPSTTPTRKGSTSKGGVRGRGAKTALVQPAESTDSWDM